MGCHCTLHKLNILYFLFSYFYLRCFYKKNPNTNKLRWLKKKKKSLLQQHNSRASVLRHSAFFRVQITSMHETGKTIALARGTFVGKVMSLLFSILSRLDIAFLPRSKRLLISWLQSPSAVIFEPQNNKVCHCFNCFPIYLPRSDVIRCHELHFSMLSFKPAFSLSSFTFIRRLLSSS